MTQVSAANPTMAFAHACPASSRPEAAQTEASSATADRVQLAGSDATDPAQSLRSAARESRCAKAPTGWFKKAGLTLFAGAVLASTAIICATVGGAVGLKVGIALEGLVTGGAFLNEAWGKHAPGVNPPDGDGE